MRQHARMDDLRSSPAARRMSWSARTARVLSLAALLALVVAAVALSLGAAPVAAQAAVTCPSQPVTGQRIYDCAGALNAGEIKDLETRALAVQRAGAPVIVYLQIDNVSYDQTLSDAASLMARWNVESKAGAKDGVVIFLNLKPGDLQHGQVALYAGQTLFNGALPQSELSRIYQDVMLPKLSSGQTAAGIGAGLDAIATDLRAGGPPERVVARAIGNIPYNILAGLLALLTLGVGLLSMRRASASMPALTTTPTTQPPANLTPAVAGALVSGKVAGQQMEATILDFARRGLLRIEPAERGKASIQLLSDGSGLSGYEWSLWQALASQTEAADVIPQERMYQVAARWRPAIIELRNTLIERGWFDGDVGKKRAPLIALMIANFLLALLGMALGALAEQVWPFIGAIICAAAGVAALLFLLRIPAVTAEGRRVAQAARDYFASLDAPESGGVDLEAALPYLVAAGRANAYGQRLLMEADRPGVTYVAMYPFWIALHSSMTPPAGSGAGGVAGATGAASGGGGAGGAF